jgi:hypothetical protein
MADVGPSERAFFERQQQRRKEMQARLAGRPAAEEPTAQEPGAEDLVTEEPLPEEPVIEEPLPEVRVIEEPVIEEPGTEEPETEEPGTEDLVAEPLAEVPVIEVPVLEELVIEEPPAGEPPPPQSALRFVVTSNRPNVGQTFGLHGRELIIGREQGSDIQLDDLTVSHNHALVRTYGEVVTIEDLRSKNGTTVNGVAISRPVRISPRDVITVGAVELLLEQYQAGGG